MDVAINILILSVFLAEVALLYKLERVVWGTAYTPLNMLSLPFTAILLMTLCLPSSLGFVDFYYPSLLVWMGGLLLMAIPSWLLGIGFRKRYGETELAIEPPKKERLFLIVTLLLIVPFVFRLREMMATSLDLFGSDEFGESFAVYGFYGHLLTYLLACSILCFACIRTTNRWLPTLAILLIAALSFVNQVKSWVIIPIIAGLILCLSTGKLKLTLRLIVIIIVSGIAIFVGSYLTIFIIGNGATYDAHMGEYIAQHVIHYFCSGLLGMSEDIRQGVLEVADPDVLFAPFINVVRTMTGETYVSPINPIYLEINTNNALQDNVRTFFGTIYANCSVGLFCVVVLFWSCFLYLTRIFTLYSQSIYIKAIDSWFCALLAMGWFEYYFFHSATFEIPLFLILMHCIEKIAFKKQYGHYYSPQL